MLDFTSSLYLGMRHASRDLRPWDSLTRGMPAALVPPALALQSTSHGWERVFVSFRPLVTPGQCASRRYHQTP